MVLFSSALYIRVFPGTHTCIFEKKKTFYKENENINRWDTAGQATAIILEANIQNTWYMYISLGIIN